MANTVNENRIKKRGNALLKIYTKNRKVVPTLNVFINDYFKIVDPSKSNQFTVKQTVVTLKDVYNNFTTEKKTKTAIMLIL